MSGRKRVVVIGHGMVGHRFCVEMAQRDPERNWEVVVFGEELRAAYDRVGLTQFFAHKDASRLQLASRDWYREQGIALHTGDPVVAIDRSRLAVRTASGKSLYCDRVVVATGSIPFVPDIPGTGNLGVFLYRTIDDLERISTWSEHSRRAAVIGGGLLGLEAAKACVDMGLETHVIEFAPRLMPRQLDEPGAALLRRKVEEVGVQVHLGTSTKAILGESSVEGLEFMDGEQLPLDMVIISAGIRPRDDLARAAGLDVGERGGLLVNDRLESSDPAISAIGEVALHRNRVYGLVAPGYEMAAIVADNLTGGTRIFGEGDLSAKLKLMGVDVASFGDHEAPSDRARPVVFDDPFEGVYRKLLVSHDGSSLLGGVLVGDASDYAALAAIVRSGGAIPGTPGNLVRGSTGASSGSAISVDTMPDEMQVCSCNSVTKGMICASIRERELTTLFDVKKETQAGTGCGGCLPLVSDLLGAEMAASGRMLSKDLCEHFTLTRQELFTICQVKRIRTFDELLGSHGTGNGCEVCKPAVASIIASLWNEPIIDHGALQDTNDRFLANIQRGGLYSVVPRVPGGEISPEKLIVLGTVARKYGLYAKVTGGQRVDLFGARVDQLPEIWEELVLAGFESGHAYGKALRTVKSCVGSTWCRYGVRDSVGFAIRVENRYKGLRSPHKLKSAVSGCVRECAEAQSKDFGLIATEKGWNLYVGGNGGANPRHAELLATDLDEETVLRYIDRFLMYYIQTADKLTRTSVWLEKLDGGIEHLRDVVIHDKLDISDDLEKQMQFLVDSYQCEWTDVVFNQEKRARFSAFSNSSVTDEGIGKIRERGQLRPSDWPKECALPGPEGITLPDGRPLAGLLSNGDRNWVRVGNVVDFPVDGGRAILHGKTQIAVFRFESRGEWYATQNVCPHKRALVLARGIIGDLSGTPKVACPMHKKSFSLRDGKCLSGDPLAVATFPVRVEGDDVFVLLPTAELLDEALATELVSVSS